MPDSTVLTEIQARQQIAQRIAGAGRHHLPTEPHQHRRHRMAQQLRRFADRIDS